MALQDLTPQLRTRLSRAEKLVGLFILTALLLLVGAAVYYFRHLIESKGWFIPSVPYFTYVKDASGIQPGAPVKFLGRTVGEVTEVQTESLSQWNLDNGFLVFVGLKIRAPYFGYIWTDSKVKLPAGDFLGVRALEVLRGTNGILTVTNEHSKHPAVLLKDYAFTSPADRKAVYRIPDKTSKGYFLWSTEQVPLPEKLTEIANDLHAALPGVLALTNTLNETLRQTFTLATNISETLPGVRSAVREAEQLVADLRPLTKTPGAIGNLVLPPDLRAELMTVLSNASVRSAQLGPTLSNIESVITRVGVTVDNVNQQLTRDTNLVSNINRLADEAGELADTATTLMRRHWLFRSAFKTNGIKGR